MIKKNRTLYYWGQPMNLKQIHEKERQSVDAIFLASLFNKKKTYLGFNKFKNLSKLSKVKNNSSWGYK